MSTASSAGRGEASGALEASARAAAAPSSVVSVAAAWTASAASARLRCQHVCASSSRSLRSSSSTERAANELRNELENARKLSKLLPDAGLQRALVQSEARLRAIDRARVVRLGAEALQVAETRLSEINGDAERQARREALGLGNMRPPDEFMCPITYDKMRDPVVASERVAAEGAEPSAPPGCLRGSVGATLAADGPAHLQPRRKEEAPLLEVTDVEAKPAAAAAASGIEAEAGSLFARLTLG